MDYSEHTHFPLLDDNSHFLLLDDTSHTFHSPWNTTEFLLPFTNTTTTIEEDINSSTLDTNSSISENGDTTHMYFDLSIGMWIPGILCILGSLGNAVSLCVLSRYRSHNVTFYSLRALAVSDIVLLMSAFVQQIIPMACIYCKSSMWMCRNIAYIRVYSWPIVCMGQMCSIWMTVVISAERYQAVCRPLQSRHTQTLPLVRGTIFCISVVAIIFNMPKFYEYYPEAVVGSNNVTTVRIVTTSLREDVVYRYLYNIALNCIFVYALPFGILIYLNSMIVYTLRSVMKSMHILSRQQQSEHRATTVPLCIVAVFILCDTHALICFILDAIYVDSYGIWLQYYTAISNLLVILNSAVNFLIFYFFGAKFRKQLLHLLPCTGTDMKTGNSVMSPIYRKRFSSVITESTLRYTKVVFDASDSTLNRSSITVI